MSLTNSSPEQAARAAKVSSRKLATLSVNARNNALDAIHDALSNAKDSILAANAEDLAKAKQSTANGELNASIYKRLDLSRPGKFDDMLQGIRDVKGLPDPGRPESVSSSLQSELLRSLSPALSRKSSSTSLCSSTISHTSSRSEKESSSSLSSKPTLQYLLLPMSVLHCIASSLSLKHPADLPPSSRQGGPPNRT